MSNAVFPTLPGLAWPQVQRPTFDTAIHRAVGGFERRSAWMAYPLWEFDLDFEVLRDTRGYSEVQTLLGFFLSRQGALDSFLYTNPDDKTVTDYQFGVGNGSAVAFPLNRSYGGFIEPVQNLNGAVTNIKDNGVTVNPANYSVSATGVVTFTVAPLNGRLLTWTGSYYYRVRLREDRYDFRKLMDGRSELRGLGLVGSPINKV